MALVGSILLLGVLGKSVSDHGATIATSASDSIYLTVAYCPTVFSGKGAVVLINGDTFEVSLNGKFNWPDGIDDACPVEEDANFESDTVVGTRHTHLSFGTEWGLVVAVDVDSARITWQAKGSSGDLYLFDGFTSFALEDDGKHFIGLTPHVTESGFCDDGCFRFGRQSLLTGVFHGLHNEGIPFKAIMTNVCFYDRTANTFHIQGSYPLTEEAACSKVGTDQCMITIDASTGAFVGSHPTPDFEVYHYQDFVSQPSANGTVIAWVYTKSCGGGLDSYGFARVDPHQGSYTLISCIEQSTTIVHTTPDYGAFNQDATRFVTGSGNPYVGEMQLLVFDVSSGKTLLNSKLPTLKKLLGVSNEAPFIALWGITHLPPTHIPSPSSNTSTHMKTSRVGKN